MSLTSYLAAPSRDLESICRGVRNRYKAFPQHVKYFQIIFYTRNCMTKTFKRIPKTTESDKRKRPLPD